MQKALAVVIIVAGLSIAGSPLLAHHGRGATYDMKKQVTLKGTVSEVAWRNPHVVIYLDVKEPDGALVNWAFENSSVGTLARQGYNRNTLRAGQEITAIVNPSVQGAPRGIVVKVVLGDGREIMSRETGANPVD
ncbi:MAG: hypothetical protein HY824_15150 [Acidobacteria bacterium]|nr:hypothetical protein [Acidobacteriota bacterium]